LEKNEMKKTLFNLVDSRDRFTFVIKNLISGNADVRRAV
jgi:hypothetical protein